MRGQGEHEQHYTFIQYPDNCLVIIAAIDANRFVHAHSLATRISTTRIICLLLYMHISLFLFILLPQNEKEKKRKPKKDGDFHFDLVSIDLFLFFFFSPILSIAWLDGRRRKKRHPFWLAFRRGFCCTVYKSILPQLGGFFFFLSFFPSSS